MTKERFDIHQHITDRPSPNSHVTSRQIDFEPSRRLIVAAKEGLAHPTFYRMHIL